MGRKRSLSKQIINPETGRSDRTARQRTFATGGNRPSAAAHAREPNDSNVAYCCHPTRESERQKRSEGRRSHLGRFGAPEQKTRVPVSGRSCPAASGRVEMWRGGGRSEHRCCRPFRLAVPYEPDHGSVSTSRSSVGSRTVAPSLGSGGCPSAFALDLSPAAVDTFPAPATSNATGGFPALRSPACFASRVMGPILLGTLSAPGFGLGNR